MIATHNTCLIYTISMHYLYENNTNLSSMQNMLNAITFHGQIWNDKLSNNINHIIDYNNWLN
jgi:hypothetical protein